MKNNIYGFEGEKIECSEFTEKVGKNVIDYKFEYKTHLKIIEMQHKELETYKKIAEKLAEDLSKHIWLNDKEAILKIYREKVEEDEIYS